MITGSFPNLRLRRSRKKNWSRRLIAENNLTPSDFILPVFLTDGRNKKQGISSMPGVHRYSLDKLSSVVDRALKLKLPMIALFPYTNRKDKDKFGTEALNEDNLVCKALQLIKKKYRNEIGIMCDVALDPYTSHGQDGLVNNRYVLNDETVEILIKQSLLQLIDMKSIPMVGLILGAEELQIHSTRRALQTRKYMHKLEAFS